MPRKSQVHDDPEQSTAQMYLWVHQQQDEIREVVEGGDDTGRIDWIDRNMDCELSGHGLHVRLVDQEDGQTLREAIDDAISLWGPIDRARGEGE